MELKRGNARGPNKSGEVLQRALTLGVETVRFKLRIGHPVPDIVSTGSSIARQSRRLRTRHFRPNADNTFEWYLENWYFSTPREHKPFVKDVVDVLNKKKIRGREPFISIIAHP